MESRWIPHFLAMLKRMEYLGNEGSSRYVGLYADWDGDFQPKFEIPFEEMIYKEIKPRREDKNENQIYDAG